MAKAMRYVLPILMPLVLLAGCAGPESGYPSLATRPAERAYAATRPGAPAPAATPAPTDATLTERLATLRNSAEAAHQRFLKRKPEADRLTTAARGSMAGGEAWSVAQLSLAQLESARNDTSVILADLDAILLAADLASLGQPSADLAAIRNVHGEVSQLVAQESEAVNAYAARFAG